MRSLMYVLSAAAVMALAFWAYRENYATQVAIREVRDLHSQIGAAHSRLRVLKAEWAYLNRPERLKDLVEANFDDLGLLPLTPDSFGAIEQVAYPAPPELLEPLEDTIEVSAANAPEAQFP